MEESPWTEEDEEGHDHPYYNNIPGKMPPPGGFIDARLSSQSAGGAEGGQVSVPVATPRFILYTSSKLGLVHVPCQGED